MTDTTNTLIARRMTGRDPRELHRVVTPLELYFDLAFVVAISIASAQLYTVEAAGVGSSAWVSYLMVFFAIWWAWMNFTWFASAFDTGDAIYRIVTFVQMGGALIVAAGAAPIVQHGDFTLGVLGYTIMRLAMVSQWLRLACSDPEYRKVALRFAIGITIVQIGWVIFLQVPASVQPSAFLVIMVAELLVPPFAERARATPWHPRHIAERYSLFTLIALGETFPAVTTAII